MRRRLALLPTAAAALLAIAVPAAAPGGAAPPVVAIVITANGLSSSRVAVAVGGTVLWANATGATHRISAAGDRFPGFTLPAFSRHSTVFHRAGSYPFRLDGGESGTIDVTNGSGAGAGQGGGGGSGRHAGSKGGYSRCCFVVRLFASHQLLGDFADSPGTGDYPTAEEVHVQWEGYALVSYSDTGPRSRPKLKLVPGVEPRVGAWFMEHLVTSESPDCLRSWSTSGSPDYALAFLPQPGLFRFGPASIAADAGPPIDRRFVDCGYDGTTDSADAWDTLPPPWHGTFAYPPVAAFRRSSYFAVVGPHGSFNGTVTGHGDPHHADGGGALSLQFSYVPGGSSAQRAAAAANFEKKYPATSPGFAEIPN